MSGTTTRPEAVPPPVPTPGRPTEPGASDGPGWVVVRPAGPPQEHERLPRLRSVLLQVGAAALVVVIAVSVVGLLVSRRTAENESVRDAATLTSVLADSVVQPALTDAMATSSAAAAGLDELIRTRVLSPGSLVRVKLWTPQGRILYSDEPRLVGRVFGLEADARDTLTDPRVSAAISDLDEPENRYERGRGTLLEVHRPVYTPGGRPLLFETYFVYDEVVDRSTELWRGFAGITLGSIGLLVLLLVPLAWTLVLRARRAQRQRETMLRRAADASLDERRRIAATLHDGVVQELVAASFVVAGVAQDAEAAGEHDLALRLREARDAVRSGIGGMRSLLVDIYPPNLHEAGLPSALRDLATALRVDVDLAVDDEVCAGLDRESTEALFRIAQEALRNVAAHAHASAVTVTLHRAADEIVLEIADDGVGFGPSLRPDGHFGTALMADVAGGIGAELALRTAPGAGTLWRLRLPVAGVA